MGGGGNGLRADYQPLGNQKEQVFLVRSRETLATFECRRWIMTSQQLQEIRLRMQSRLQLRSNSLHPLSERIEQPSQLCRFESYVFLLSPQPISTMQRQLQVRRRNKQLFTVAQILRVSLTLTTACQELNRIQQYHGNITFQSVLITGNRQIVLKDPLLQPQSITKKDQALRVQLPSPQRLISYFDQSSTFNKYLADLFSVGMIALQMCYPQKSIPSEVYNLDYVNYPTYQNVQIKQHNLKQLTNQVNHPFLRQLISTLTSKAAVPRQDIQHTSFPYDQFDIKWITHDTPLSLHLTPSHKEPEEVDTLKMLMKGEGGRGGEGEGGGRWQGRRGQGGQELYQELPFQFMTNRLPSQTPFMINRPASQTPPFQLMTKRLPSQTLSPLRSNIPQIPRSSPLMKPKGLEIGVLKNDEESNMGKGVVWENKQGKSNKSYITVIPQQIPQVSHRGEGKSVQLRMMSPLQNRVQRNTQQGVVLNHDFNQHPPQFNTIQGRQQTIHHPIMLNNTPYRTVQPNTQLEIGPQHNAVQLGIGLPHNTQYEGGYKNMVHVNTMQHNTIHNTGVQNAQIQRRNGVGGQFRAHSQRKVSFTHGAMRVDSKGVGLGVDSRGVGLGVQTQPIVQGYTKLRMVPNSPVTQQFVPSTNHSVSAIQFMQSFHPNETQSVLHSEHSNQQQTIIKVTQPPTGVQVTQPPTGVQVRLPLTGVHPTQPIHQTHPLHPRHPQQLQQTTPPIHPTHFQLQPQQEMRMNSQQPIQSGVGVGVGVVPEFERILDEIHQKIEQIKVSGQMAGEKAIVLERDVVEGDVYVVDVNVGDRAKYSGYRRGGVRYGFGKMQFNDGSYYEGNWKDNEMDGYGELFYHNGKLAYAGEWLKGIFHGRGILYNDQPTELMESNIQNLNELEDQWVSYEGGFQNDFKCGKGILLLSNGDKYQGYFKDDKIHGNGILIRSNGSTLSGVWSQGQLLH